MIKSLINNALKKLGYRCAKIENVNSNKNEESRFSLNTGERQVANKLEGIRKDHVVRYDIVANFLLNNYDDTFNLIGGDIFCGNGYGSHLVSNRIGCYIFGIDASSEAIALANEYYANDKMFFINKVFPFKIPNNVFDFVVSFETIEHLVEDLEFVNELYSSIKQGGYLFLSAPNEEICNFDKNNYEFHIKHYTFDEIRHIIESDNKFELITWFGNGAYDFENGVYVKNREEGEMTMKEKVLDSHLTYVFKRK